MWVRRGSLSLAVTDSVQVRPPARRCQTSLSLSWVRFSGPRSVIARFILPLLGIYLKPPIGNI